MLEFLLFFMVIMLLIGVISIPIMIANARGICGGKKTSITILSWLGIFFGLTWIVALVMALVWDSSCDVGYANLDKLEKAAKLYKDKVISKAEYEAIKEKLLK